MEHIKKINSWLFVLLFFVLPFPRQIVLWVWVAWAVSWLLEGRWLHKANIQWGWRMMPPLFLFGFVLWKILSLLWAGPTGRFPDPELSFLIFPLFMLFGLNEYYDWKRCGRALVEGSVCSFFVYWLLLYLKFGSAELCYFDWQLSATYKHRMLYDIILSVSIVMLFMLRSHRTKSTVRWKEIGYRVTWWFSLAIIITTIIATGGRANILALLVLGAAAVVINVPKYKGWVAAAMVLFAVGGSWLFWRYYPRMQNITLDNIINIQDHYSDDLLETEPRVIIWSLCLEHPKDYLAHGLGAGNIFPYLRPKYETFGQTIYIQDQYKAHNQFLSVLMELGLVAMLLFVVCFWCIPWCFPKGLGRKFALFYILIIGLSLMTDDNLSRLEGVIYLCVCLFLSDLMVKEQTDKQLSN